MSHLPKDFRVRADEILFQVAFVMLNLDGHGYNVNPFGGDDEEYIAQAKNLSSMLSTAWVNFITVLDPNGAHGLPDGTMWPLYDAAGKVGQVIVWDLGESTIETDDWRTDGIAWFIDHALSVFGS
jgi:carboxylesterase type B